jgi:hypothetical protein
VSVKEFAHLMPNPVLIYSALALYGVLIVVVLAYVHARFSSANKLLQALQHDWASAESSHKNLLVHAREHVTKLTAPAPQPLPATAGGTRASVNFDTRNQVVAMGKKGLPPKDIARSCGLSEGDVDVLLGMARIQK